MCDKVMTFDKVVLDIAVTKVGNLSHRASGAEVGKLYNKDSRYEGKGASVGVEMGGLIPSDNFNLEHKITLDKSVEGNVLQLVLRWGI